MSIIPLSRRSNRPDQPDPISKHHAAFARQAVRLEFRPRDARAIDQSGFVDRGPGEAPRALGPIATKITQNTGQKSLHYWLNQAGRADTDDERKAALHTAHEIARLAGLDADLIGHEAA